MVLAALWPVRTQAQDKPAELGLAVYKAGEKYATDEHATDAIDKLAGHLDGALKKHNVAVKRRGVRNDPEAALKLFKDDKQPVALAIVSPAFYLRHKEELKLTALAEAKRGGKDGEQFTLVGADKAEKYPEGKRIATTLTAEQDWLNRVVLPAPQGAKPVVWVQHDNLFDAAYAIIDGEKDAPDFVLADAVTLEAFDKDGDLKDLKQGLKSEKLPQDLVVEVDKRVGAARDDLVTALTGLDGTEGGKKIGELIQSPTFRKPDTDRLEKAGKLWQSK
ncbi:MAG: hypothetical protein KF696_03400 [Planctomycetes bacterium]|nr:hypothetical protein [Planctomycetota bacterium]MCW8135052.1 hypothetical protein [Planctomycetota bacterium]